MEKQKQGNGNGNGKLTLTRRDFLKTAAAAGAGGGLVALTEGFNNVLAVPPPTPATVAKTVPTTCACCSVGCGQLVDLDGTGPTANILDVRGDPNHVTNRGANCPKGAASVQWINGDRRLGTTTNVLGVTGPMYRQSDVNGGAWTAYASWDAAITDAATRLLSARDADVAPGPGNYYHSKTVAFLGCSHATNEENYIYRKLIANIGTNNIEHQARI